MAMARPMPRLAPVTRPVMGARSYPDGVLQSEAEPGLGRNLHPLTLGKDLYRAARAGAGSRAYGRSFASSEDATEDCPHRRGAADNLGALAGSRLAGGGDLLRVEVHHPAAHADRNQVHGKLGPAADLARLFVFDQLRHHIGAAINQRVSIRPDDGIIETSLKSLPELTGFRIDPVNHPHPENR